MVKKIQLFFLAVLDPQEEFPPQDKDSPGC